MLAATVGEAVSRGGSDHGMGNDIRGRSGACITREPKFAASCRGMLVTAAVLTA
jgi:hypothetical protein